MVENTNENCHNLAVYIANNMDLETLLDIVIEKHEEDFKINCEWFDECIEVNDIKTEQGLQNLANE